ncbi:DEAD/DEAH box helicase, partial [Candidatus Berkelbacteria bacterium]|nr:DEAD/DEAH box helicase [Candidatus Berkelbacteria bacterium]
PGIGAKFGQKLAAAGLATANDLLNYFPYRFEDFTNPAPIARVQIGEHVVVAGTLTQARNERSARRRMALTKALLADESGSITAIWFNQPFMVRQLGSGGTWYLTGKVGYDRSLGKLLYVSTLERRASIFPIYHEHEGLTSRWLRNFLGKVLGAARLVPETLPDSFVTGHNLMGRADAIAAIHHPQSARQLSEAKHRLSIEELLPIMVRNIRARRELASEQAPAMAYDQSSLKQFTGSLPFTLTNDQRLAAWRIIQDLGKPTPMNRLLQGEVGSGKTVVAAMAVAVAARAGYQTLWLAPTEILANQHYRSVSKLLSKFGVSVGLWTAGSKVDGGAQLVIGTHALLTEGLKFPKLGLVIVDE